MKLEMQFKFIMVYKNHDIYLESLGYYITTWTDNKRSRSYDELWYAKRAIDQNNIDWIKS